MRVRSASSSACITALVVAGCSTVPAVHPNRVDGPLPAMMDALREPLARLSSSAPGLRARAGEEGLEGRTYRASLHEAGDGSTELAVGALVRNLLGADPRDPAFYLDVEQLAAPTAADLEEALRMDDSPFPLRAEERDRLRTFAQELIRETSDLAILRVRSGWADAVGESHHGIVVFDSSRREVLWVRVLEAWGA